MLPVTVEPASAGSSASFSGHRKISYRAGIGANLRSYYLQPGRWALCLTDRPKTVAIRSRMPLVGVSLSFFFRSGLLYLHMLTSSYAEIGSRISIEKTFFMALVAATALGGTAAAAMYLDAKYAFREDLRKIRRANTVANLHAEAAKKKRLSLWYFFEDAVDRRRHEECLWSREGCYKWSQSYERANQYAQWYLSQGVRPHDYVAFYLSNSPDFIFAWMGLWAIGAAPAMINYNLAGKALIHCLTLCQSKFLLLDEDSELRARIEGVREHIERDLGMRIYVLDSETKSQIRGLAPKRPEDTFREEVTADGPMVLFYTSGTTGMPKGVPFTIERGFELGASRAAGSSFANEKDRWYDCMPMYHGTGGILAVTMMMTGVTLCIGKKFSTSKFWTEIRDSRATWITYVGETARYLLTAPPSNLDKAHNVRGMYGNGLRPDVWIKFRDRFGITEIVEFFNSSEGVFGLLNYCKGDYLAFCVGHHGAILRHKFRNSIIPVLIDQESGAIERDPKTGFAIRQPYEKGGEIIVAVPSIGAFAGYYNNPEATMKKFEKDVIKKGDLWYRTGDALRRTKDGKWFFMDRLGDTFRWKGENVSTAEVSAVLGKFPGIVEANVYGVALPKHDGRAGCAAVFIDPKFKKDFDFAGLLKHSQTHLPKYAVPVFLRVVREMTPIHNNKQNKVPLREEGVDPDKVKSEDKLLWISETGRGNTYVDFHRDHWEELNHGRAQL